MGGSELLYISLGGLFHFLADFVDLTSDHVVEFAIIPDQLDVCEDFFVRGVLAGEEFALAGGEIHRIFYNLRVVK